MTSPVALRVVGWEMGLVDCALRIPFRYGVVTLTEAPQLTLQVEVEDEQGGRACGYAADLLAPKWFDKDPSKSNGRNCRDLLASAERAVVAYADPAAERGSVFDHWRRVHGACHVSGARDPSGALVSGFGIALGERAVMDAACRLTGASFAGALREDLFGFRPGEIWPELAGWDHAADLGAPPRERMVVRHTVGLGDALRPSEVRPEERLDDGLPECLVDDIRRYGLNTFKVKLSGRHEEDLARLLAFAEVVGEHVPAPLQFTVDANEQFRDVAGVVRLLDETSRHPAGQALLNGLLLVEQPIPRQDSFDPSATAAMEALADYAPCIIDEADVDVDSFERALEHGYRGVSVKNCKGVFRSLLNRGLVCARSHGVGDLFQSGEDLTNIAMLSLQQDLVTQAVLGVEHVERNGHHYLRGLDHLTESEREGALARHPDLYEQRDGVAQVRIRDGVVELGSLHGPGYGHGGAVEMGHRMSPESWSEGSS